MHGRHGRLRALLALACGLGLAVPLAGHAWEPSRTVEFVVPAGTGGGADQMARIVQSIIAKNGLMKQPLVVVNRAGGAGAEGFLDVKKAQGDPHKIIITLSNLFTTPLATGVPFSWRDLTPVQMLALDAFVLWVNADSSHASVGAYLEAAKGAGAGRRLKMAGTGSRQEDQIITAAIEKAAGARFTYVPFKGGGDVVVQLVGGHVDSTVNNPIEAVAQWRAGKLRPLCVFSAQRMQYSAKVTGTAAWSDIATCREQGLAVEYQMLRGIFMPAGVTQEQVAYYVGVLGQVRETPEWKEFLEKGAFDPTALRGAEFAAWVEREDARHRELMTEAGFLAGAPKLEPVGAPRPQP